MLRKKFKTLLLYRQINKLHKQLLLCDVIWDYLTLIDALVMIYACVTYRVVRRIVVAEGA